MSSRRNGMRKQVLKAKEGPLELRREEGKDNPPVREAEGKRKGSCLLYTSDAADEERLV